jgi:hypothetical protein
MLHENGEQRMVIYPEGGDTMISVAPARHTRAAAAQPEELSEESDCDDGAMEAVEGFVAVADAVCDAGFVAAAAAGQLEVVKYFIEQVGPSRKVLSAALAAASGAGHLEIVTLIVEHPAFPRTG